MKTIINRLEELLLAGVLTLVLSPDARADVQWRSGSGTTPADLQNIVDVFKADLGGVDNGEGGSATTGYRTLDWDGVSDALAAPGMLPPDYYTSTSLRGAFLSTPSTLLQVSASAASGVPVNFGNVNPSYATMFQPFSGERLFTPLSGNVTDVHFFVPSDSAQPAYVSGFGAVFADVDLTGETSIELFDLNGQSLFAGFVPTSPDNGLSFLGIYMTAGEQVSWVRITSGTAALDSGMLEGGGTDMVAMDNFFFGEPQPVPEPGGFVLFGVGLVLWVGVRVWRRSAH